MIPTDFIEAIRKRPGMYCGDTGELGLHHLVYLLLDSVLEEALLGECGDVVLELGGDNSIALFSTSRTTVPVGDVVPVVKGNRFLGPPLEEGLFWDSRVVVSLALSSRYQVDIWSEGRQWRLMGEHGRHQGDVREVTPKTPMPVSAERGVRVHFVPDATIFEVLAFDRKRLSRRCNELAALAPGLRVAFVDLQRGERTLWHLPGGVAQWVRDLTEARPRLHPEPVAFDFTWDGLRVQCALQWCEDEDSTLLSFANAVWTVRHGAHVKGVTQALRGALAKLSGESRLAFPWERVALGLTAIVAVSGPQRQMAFEGPTKTLLAIPGLEQAIRKQLRPLFIELLREHPVTPLLLARRKPVAR